MTYHLCSKVDITLDINTISSTQPDRYMRVKIIKATAMIWKCVFNDKYANIISV
uniref:Uncharacterized protein n=1 Tax=Arundo donax TaxID=35708 RepID=A0A0A9HHQ7_ARUDO